MEKPVKIESFIRAIFELYGLDYGQYFSDYDEDNERAEIPMVRGGTLDMDMVNRAAEILGEDVEDLLTMNGNRTGKWAKRFPFIDLKRELEHAYARSFCGKSYDTLRLLEVVFDVEYPNKPTRYNYEDVKKRLFALLKEYDKVAPGIYHKGQAIKYLHIDTTGFCHFEKIELMLASFFEMVDRAGSLFFKAWDIELSAEEIREYNIIVSVLGIRDRCLYTRGDLHYSMLRSLVPVYRLENETEFFDYVMLDPQKDIMPWRCAEFTQNRELVQTYANIFPTAKRSMWEYALRAAKFHCSFAWSDAKPLEYSAGKEENTAGLDQMLKFIRRRDKYGGLEPTTMYVPKTDEELGEDGAFAEALKKLSGPERAGGIAGPTKIRGKLLDIPRMAARIKAIGGGGLG